MHLLFEDNHLFVLNKPTGLLTQPSGTSQASLECLGKSWIKERDGKPGNVFLCAIHRLDKPASGIVVLAKTSKALSRLNASMRLRQIKKTYWTWVEGSPTENEALLEHTLLHTDFHAILISPNDPRGKTARLTYRVLIRDRGRTLLEVELETGRYHQIRLQLSAIGHPICGDRQYGSIQSYVPEAIALHHRHLQLLHPISQKPMSFQAPPPLTFSSP